MTDIVDRPTRSRMMRGITGRNTKPELAIRQRLHAAGFRFRLHAASLPGRPDLVIKKYNAVVFVHGCFWHGHAGCPYFRLPGTNSAFWEEKIASNRIRDSRQVSDLEDVGWRVAIVWECAVRAGPDAAARRLEEFLLGTDQHAEIASERALPVPKRTA